MEPLPLPIQPREFKTKSAAPRRNLEGLGVEVQIAHDGLELAVR
jgi:hypothetical protein